MAISLKSVACNVVNMAIEEAFAKFTLNPNGENWGQLERCMYAFQKSKFSSEDQLSFLKKVPVLNWVDAIFSKVATTVVSETTDAKEGTSDANNA